MAMTTAAAKPRTWWWMFLITGTLWMALSLIVLRFNLVSLATIGILFGVVAIVAGINEFIVGAAVPTWKALHYVAGALFVAAGAVALFNPATVFWTLAYIVAWYLLFKGALDIVVSIATRHENEAWWLGLTAGILQVAVAFWAAGNYGRSIVLLVTWVAIACMLRGITEIVTAFHLRRLGQEAEALVQAARAGYAATTAEWPAAARPTAPAGGPTATTTVPGGPGTTASAPGSQTVGYPGAGAPGGDPYPPR